MHHGSIFKTIPTTVANGTVAGGPSCVRMRRLLVNGAARDSRFPAALDLLLPQRPAVGRHHVAGSACKEEGCTSDALRVAAAACSRAEPVLFQKQKTELAS